MTFHEDPKGFNLEPAVTARCVLMEEVHTLAECRALVYEPTKQRLAEFARTVSHGLRCMNSIEYVRRTQEDPSCISIDFILPNNTVLYLGAALTRKAALTHWSQRRAALRQHRQEDVGTHLDLLAWHGAKEVIIDRAGCTIPVNAESITPACLNRAVSTYMKRMCPTLRFRSINWLQDDTAAQLYEEIHLTAQEQAMPQGEEEKARIILEEHDVL